MTDSEAKKRVAKACDRCRKRKIKCDDVNIMTGKCTNCTKFKSSCTFAHHEQMMRRNQLKAESRRSREREKERGGGSSSGSSSGSGGGKKELASKGREGNVSARDGKAAGAGAGGVNLMNSSYSQGQMANGFAGKNYESPALNRAGSDGGRASQRLGGGAAGNGPVYLQGSAEDGRYVPVNIAGSMFNTAVPNPLPIANPAQQIYSMAQKFAPNEQPRLQHPRYPPYPPYGHSGGGSNKSCGSQVHAQNHSRSNIEYRPRERLDTGVSQSQPGCSTRQQQQAFVPQEVVPASVPASLPASSDGSSNSQLSDLNNKMEIVSRRVTLLLDWATRLDFIGQQCDMVLRQQEERTILEEKKKRKKNVYAVDTRYKSCQYTEQTLMWLKSKVSPEMSTEEFLKPLRSVHGLVSKWYFVQMKRLVHSISDERQLHPLPDSNRCRRIMEIYYNLLSSEDINIIERNCCQKLFDKYFSQSAMEITYSENLIVNTLLALGALYSRHSLLESNHYRKDKLDFTTEKLSEIENNCYQNALYYYHKISLASEGIRSIQGLLLLYTYIKTNVSTEAALNIFVVAIKFVEDLGFNDLEVFESFPKNEYLQIRSIILYCYLNDSVLSMSLGSVPLILESNMSIALGKNYFTSLKSDCEIIKYPDDEVLESITEEGKALSFLREKSWYFSVILNYYRALLCQISNKMMRDLYSVNVTKVKTFDDIVGKIIELKDDLIRYSDKMPDFLRQDNQRTFLARIYHELAEKEAMFNFKLMNVLISELHIKREALFIMLSTFTYKFMSDNKHLFGDSIHDCEGLVSFFETNKIQSYKSALGASKGIDFQDQTIVYYRHNIFFDLFSVALSASLHVINKIENSSSFELLCLLKDLHIRLTGNISDLYIHEETKWQVSIFLFSFQLEFATLYYSDQNSLSSTYPLKDERYKLVMERIALSIEDGTNKMISIFIKGRSTVENQSDEMAGSRKMPTWALLRPFGPIDLSPQDKIADWWIEEANKHIIKKPKEVINSDKEPLIDCSRNYKMLKHVCPDYENPFQANERWLPTDFRLFSHDSHVNRNSRKSSLIGSAHPSNFLEDINS